MKTHVSSAMTTYLASRICKTLCRCWRIDTRDGQTFGYTSHSRDLSISGLTYQSLLGFQASALKATEGLSPDNITIAAFLAQQDENNIFAGVYDHALVEVFVVNYLDLTMGKITEKVGTVGAITRSDGVFSADIMGLAQLLQTKIGEIYSISCTARLGDDRCRAVITPTKSTFTGSTSGSVLSRTDGGSFLSDGYEVSTSKTLVILRNGAAFSTTTITNVTQSTLTVVATLGTTSGTYSLSQDNQFFMTGHVTAVSSQRQFSVSFDRGTYADQWFTEGNIKFTDGSNRNILRDIRSHSGSTIELFLPLPYAIAVNDDFEMQAGCIKTKEVCFSKFGNIANYRGFPFLPTPEQVYNSPISSGSTIVTAV